MKLSDAKSHIEQALTRMLQQPWGKRPFVIVEDKVTKRFVQFLTTKKRDLVFDIPQVELSRTFAGRSTALRIMREEERRNDVLFSSMSLNIVCSTVEVASSIALRVLREVHDLPDFAELKIIEEPERERPN